MPVNKHDDIQILPGDRARDFSLQDSQGRKHRLTDYRGRWLVMYFYPKDNTPGCTKEACRFRDQFRQFRDLNAEVIGISVDNAASHNRFSEKYQLPFPLLVDQQGQVASSYGALRSFGPFRHARRQTFIIDPLGNVALIYRRVRPGRHSQEVIKDLQMLQRGYPQQRPH